MCTAAVAVAHFVALFGLASNGGCMSGAASPESTSDEADPTADVKFDGQTGMGHPASGDPLEPETRHVVTRNEGDFREVLALGHFPGPNTFDARNFFAAHPTARASASCEELLCITPRLAITSDATSGTEKAVLALSWHSNFDSSGWPTRRPIDLTVAIDTGSSMEGAALESLRWALGDIVALMDPMDTLSIVGYGDIAQTAVRAATADDPALSTAIAGLNAVGHSNAYDGLRTAFELAASLQADNRESRVLLAANGAPTVGLTDPRALENLAAAHARAGIGLATLALGRHVDSPTLRRLAALGGGAFRHVLDPEDLDLAMVELGRSRVTPLATHATLDVSFAPGYRVHEAHGSPLTQRVEQRTLANLPLVTSRLTTDGMTRHTGPGLIVFEATVEPTLGSSAPQTPTRLATVELEFSDLDGRRQQASITVESPYLPGEVPPLGHFDGTDALLAQVVTDLFVSMRNAALRVHDGDFEAAARILAELELRVTQWQLQLADPHVAESMLVLQQFMGLLAEHSGA